ncbi:MAG: ABC transporter ATP-binding protein [Chloroflexi bacterium]|nr:ABC transporter ATP-binding protein [Chloroflexota bacterium]
MLQLTDIYKAFNPQTPVLANVNLNVAAGEIVALLGPSGCGKTTLLRIVAGLEQADRGSITFEGHDLAQTPVHKRNFGLMFQDYALFPHRTVGENIAFGLRMLGQSKPQIAKRTEEMLSLVNLSGYGSRSIFALSGGERQRVALARSLAPNPRLLMLDEPLGSLDRALREELMSELRLILKRLGMTALYVTHDQQEAFAIADRLVVMRRGRIEQVGAPAEVYHQPANAFVAAFLGFRNLLPANVTPVTPEKILTPIGQFPTQTPVAAGEYTLLIRPQAAKLASTAQPNATEPHFLGKLLACSFRGDYYQIQVAPAATQLVLTFELAMRPGEQLTDLSVGNTYSFTLEPALLTLLPAVE